MSVTDDRHIRKIGWRVHRFLLMNLFFGLNWRRGGWADEEDEKTNKTFLIGLYYRCTPGEQLLQTTKKKAYSI